MKSFVNCIISFVFLCISGLCTSLDAAQSSKISDISSETSSRISALSSSIHSMDVTQDFMAAQQRKRKIKQEASDSDESKESVAQRRRVNFSKDIPCFGPRNMIIVCEDGSESSPNQNLLGACMKDLVSVIIQRPPAYVLIHEGMWKSFISREFKLGDGPDCLSIKARDLFDENAWEMYKISVPQSSECFYLLVPKLYKNLIEGRLIEASQVVAEYKDHIFVPEKSVQCDENMRGILQHANVTDPTCADWLLGLKFSQLERVLNPCDVQIHARGSSSSSSSSLSSSSSSSQQAISDDAVTNEALQKLPMVLESLFVTRKDIDAFMHNEQVVSSMMNTWNFYILGHGEPMKGDQTFCAKLQGLRSCFPLKTMAEVDAFKLQRRQLFADSEILMGGVTIDVFAELTELFSTLLKTHFLYLQSCFAADENLVLLNMIGCCKRSFIMATGVPVHAGTTSTGDFVAQNAPAEERASYWEIPVSVDGKVCKWRTSIDFKNFFLGLNNQALFKQEQGALSMQTGIAIDYFTHLTNYANRFLAEDLINVVSHDRIPLLSIGEEWFVPTPLENYAVAVTSDLIAKKCLDGNSLIDARDNRIVWLFTPKVMVPLCFTDRLKAIVPLVNTASAALAGSYDFLTMRHVFFNEFIVARELKVDSEEKEDDAEENNEDAETKSIINDFVAEMLGLKLIQSPALSFRPNNTIVLIKKLTCGDTVIKNICVIMKTKDPFENNVHVEDNVPALAIRYVDDQDKTYLITYEIDDNECVEDDVCQDTSQNLDTATYESIYNELCLKALGEEDFVRMYDEATLTSTKTEAAQRAQAAQ